MDDGSKDLLLPSQYNRKTEFKAKKLQQNRAANALFCGVVLGFIFSFLFAYSGMFDEGNSINYSIYDLISVKNNDTDLVTETTNLAVYLQGKVRVLCMMMTSPKYFDDTGYIIMDTWGKRCNKILFFMNGMPKKPNHTNSTVVVLAQTDGFAKLREALKYVYTHHLDDFDWILKTNDDAFVVLENLRHLLYQYEPNWPVVIGQRFLREDYMLGAYALSMRAFTRLVEDSFTNSDICSEMGSPDIEISKCLEHVNVIKVDGVDRDGRGQFFASSPESALFPEKFDQYDEYYWHKLKQGEECCSDRLVLIQNSWGTHLYYLEYFIYKVHAFGRHRNREPLPKKLTLEEIVKNNI